MPLNVAIIEDEPAIARNLEFSLNEIDSSITILNKLTSVKESVNWLKENIQRCDLLFMDIRLTDGLSFEIFNSITPTIPVVFITAYDDYALEAFKVNSIDYILKPFEKSDLVNALEKFNKTSKPKETAFSYDKLQALLNYFELKEFKSYKEAYLVHYQNKLIPLNVEKINWFYTTQEIVYAHTYDGKKYVIDSTLERIQEEISPKQFYRANRQFIVQKKAIQDIDFYFNGRLLLNVLPKPEEKIIVSKAKSSEFKKWLDE
ncbi:LytTR family DNA-binding domain-containing protein [Lutibacter sp. B1]|uniref:LytR/AlgR family response regulator transcription factor n=1 Tax=Lutibacter sp. B1 TaxID=2725996 RepID=UPI0014574B40|nr:LytTR family DNA-binding domain-containing protein [Lutibacter sp. B1]NLP58646.1 response regulator transcription factor [Lutibacter sp. B1]